MSNTNESSTYAIDEQNKSPRHRLRSNSYGQAMSDDQVNESNSTVTKSSDQTISNDSPNENNSTVTKLSNQVISNDQPKDNNVTATASPPTPDKKPFNNEQTRDDIYMIKWIEFNQDRLPILLQNLNGPCPLLAITNILFLTKRIHLKPTAGAISTEQLIAAIAEHILQLDPKKLSNEDRANFEHNIEDALAVLPKLNTGIDVNLKFNGVNKFEYTRECIIFDLLGIQLFHGWIIDPQNNELQKIVNSNGSSYNQLVEKMIRQKTSQNENLARESLLIEQFFEENSSQLTYYGILQLNETMRDNQLAVLFRNNHFSTIWKNKKQLLLLVSDQGYIDHPSIVFETLTGVDNNSSFTDGYGQIWRKPAPVDSSRDRDLAVAIHNEERRQYQEAQLRQQQYPPQRHANGYDYERQNSKKSKKKKKNRSYDDDDDSNGCILS